MLYICSSSPLFRFLVCYSGACPRSISKPLSLQCLGLLNFGMGVVKNYTSVFNISYICDIIKTHVPHKHHYIHLIHIFLSPDWLKWSHMTCIIPTILIFPVFCWLSRKNKWTHTYTTPVCPRVSTCLKVLTHTGLNLDEAWH